MKATLVKGAAFGAVVTVLALASTAAFAGTGIGKVFNIGTANRVNASTVLTGTTPGPQLRVDNASTGNGATGIAIHTDPTKPPLAVSSHVRVANLNVDLLDGSHADAFQKRVTGRCSDGTGVRQINADGSVGCTTTSVVPIRRDILALRSVNDFLLPAGLIVRTTCHVNGNPAGFTFVDGAGNGATLNWMFSRGGSTSTVDASGAAIFGGGEMPIMATTTNTIAGRFVWADAHFVVTLTLHFLDLSGRCELTGTAEIGAV